MTTALEPAHATRQIQDGRVRTNERLCREHCRLTLRVESFSSTEPGQFVHLRPSGVSFDAPQYHTWAEDELARAQPDWAEAPPMLRRAFSIAGLRRGHDGVELDVIYRVVGRGTRWMEALRAGDLVNILGPCGNQFPVSRDKPIAWMIAGGVGVPPMLFLAETLARAGKQAVAICGAQRAELLALSMRPGCVPDAAAREARPAAEEFARQGIPVVISTDDGSLGFRGHAAAALQAYAAAPVDAASIVAYTCGPERMMEAVARFCIERSIECYVCMERNMACATGTCQSCVVPIHDARDPERWRYALCCTEGPVFRAEQVIWHDTARPSRTDATAG